MQKLTITTMLTISTCHIKEETTKLLEENEQEMTDVVCYSKGEYGWFVYISEEFDESSVLPNDLIDCMRFAKSHGCDWLCLDTDGDVVDELQQYEW